MSIYYDPVDEQLQREKTNLICNMALNGVKPEDAVRVGRMLAKDLRREQEELCKSEEDRRNSYKNFLPFAVQHKKKFANVKDKD